MRLFEVGKVPCFLDKIEHAVETRKSGEEVKTLHLTLRVFPFTADWATAMPASGLVKRSLFKITDGSALASLKAVEFDLSVPRQIMKIFASTDTEEPTIAFDQVAVRKVRAKLEKVSTSWQLLFNLSFGPIGRQEAEYVIGWHTTQRAVTFDEAEPSLEFEDDGDGEGTDADQKAQQPIDGRKPMWDDDEKPKPASKAKPATERANRNLHSHQGKKKSAAKRKGARA